MLSRVLSNSKSHQDAKYYGEDEEHIKELEKQLDVFKGKIKSVYQALAQDSIAPELPVVTNETPDSFSLQKWGIVPPWTTAYSDDLRKRFVVSQSEEMFNKNIYKESAAERRCPVMVDGYFDHHHRFGKTFPYFIHHKNGDPLMVFGRDGLIKEMI